jgi:hypothetical protein
MTRKQPAEDRDVLKFKLDAVQEYISFRERVLDQLQVDLQKAALSIPPRDLIGFVDRVQHAVDEAYQVLPSGSAFEQDLAEARARFNDAYVTASECAETKSALISAGFDAGAIASGFDSTLSHILGYWVERMGRLREWVRSTEDWVGLEAELGEMIRAVGMLLKCALEPAIHLREHWLNLLDGRVSSAEQQAGRSKKRGAKKDPHVAARNKKIITAWRTGEFPPYAQLGKEFGCSAEVVRKVIADMRRRSGPTS